MKVVLDTNVVLSALLGRLLPLDESVAGFLRQFADLTLRNWNGIEVGRLAAVDSLGRT